MQSTINKDSVMITREKPSSLLKRHFFSLSVIFVCFRSHFLFTEVSEDESLFVDALVQSEQ